MTCLEEDAMQTLLFISARAGTTKSSAVASIYPFRLNARVCMRRVFRRSCVFFFYIPRGRILLISQKMLGIRAVGEVATFDYIVDSFQRDVFIPHGERDDVLFFSVSFPHARLLPLLFLGGKKTS